MDYNHTYNLMLWFKNQEPFKINFFILYHNGWKCANFQDSVGK